MISKLIFILNVNVREDWCHYNTNLIFHTHLVSLNKLTIKYI